MHVYIWVCTQEGLALQTWINDFNNSVKMYKGLKYVWQLWSKLFKFWMPLD